ncbi:4-(cytidine 5'-diphospho)-2-C-methyl-D-erythritol kinase [Blastomonas aquatica]|uniref:4-diphosphocytidyl-2-C-methyl-D-erythritol kinase n=1 Tax=Blastomonas aquatica TaxID=1510276 RepID=A0ABQ1JJ97_9SPHN|nr:4-(cytidine 5'-diphospho)-2-C-methyl-D-erythritol kinase [Blastomonas aquatica]GGB69745.1 4-diphosphocytidyl-2-C-methyl-D-erythritol kinase [Blastomonas aquatica]
MPQNPPLAGEDLSDGTSVLIETAFAKVNLALHVRRRREDGYHAIESLFAFVDDGDVLRAERRDDGALTLKIDGPFAAGLDDGPSNLVLRAALELAHCVCPSTSLGNSEGGSQDPLPHWGASLYLTKNLPVASGIGGGSADAAAALRLLNRLWDCRLDDSALCVIAESLGSDIPACVISRTLRVEGRGEALQPLELAGLSSAPILLVNPGVPLGTAPVFKGWDQYDRGALDSSSLRAIITEGRNDLEPSARVLMPEIGAVLDVLAIQSGVELARMSGSGATCFALFETTAAAEAAQRAIARAYPDWWTMCGSLR